MSNGDKTNRADGIEIKNHAAICKGRREPSTQKSGGSIVYVKNKIAREITVIENKLTRDYILWIKIKGNVLNLDSDELHGAVCILP